MRNNNNEHSFNQNPDIEHRVQGEGQKTRTLNTDSIRRANEIARINRETSEKPKEKK